MLADHLCTVKHFISAGNGRYPASVTANTNLQSKGGTGVSPGQAQAEACAYKNSPMTATRYHRVTGATI